MPHRLDHQMGLDFCYGVYMEKLRELSHYHNHSVGVLLFALTYSNPFARIVEIGYNMGYSAVMFCSALASRGVPPDQCRVVSVDLRKESWDRSLELTNLKQYHHLVIGESGKSAAAVMQALGSQHIDLLFIDGDHSYTGCQTDWKTYSPYLHEQSMVLIHDNYTKVIQKVIDEISGWHFAHIGGGLTLGRRSRYDFVSLLNGTER